MLSRRGLIVKQNAKLAKLFTIQTKLDHSKTVIFSFKEAGQFYVIPRIGGMIACSALGIPFSTQPPAMKKWAGEPEQFYSLVNLLNGNQRIVLTHLLKTVYSADKIHDGTSSCTLCMPPGYGKTYLALGFVAMFMRKTFIIVPNSILLKQWVSELNKFFAAIAKESKPSIGVYCGAKKEMADITVGIINSALKYDFSTVDIVIFDEVHMYTSPKFHDIFFAAQAPLILGLTATPNSRLDGFDKIFNWHLGATIECSNIQGWNPADVIFTTKVIKVSYKGSEEFTKCIYSETGELSFPLMVNQLVEDPNRNKLIADWTLSLYREGKNVFVFSDRREHLETISKLIGVEVEFEDTGELVSLMGGASEAQIGKARGTGRIIMTTYKYSGTGLSIDKMNALVLATPRKSNLTQIVGRIYRLSGDAKIERVIVDIVDTNTPMKSQYRHRKQTYLSLNATISNF